MESPSADTRFTGYRRDLDGLRGIAIAFVVLFHVFVDRVSGGVDVFLLLSGFFFLGSQVRNADNPDRSINPWWSLWRTARRLLPALLIVIGAVLFAMKRIPALESGELIDQLRASVLYYQNWMLITLDQDYNAASADVSPLQHLWSMSVQGQFYLMAILTISVVALLSRSTGRGPLFLRRVMTLVLTAVTLLSFLYAMWLHNVDQPVNYYSTWSRLWEITLGGLIMLIAARIILPKWVPRGILAFIGLAMILSTGFLMDGAAHFPGPVTLWPLTGAALVIVAGGGADITTRILSSRLMTWFGDIAYALYLWHWPILIISLIALDMIHVTIPLGTAVIAVSVVLAWITHRFVERPLMAKTTRPRTDDRPIRDTLRGFFASPAPWLRAIAAVALLAIAGAALIQTPLQNRQIDAARENHLDPEIYPGALAVTDDYPVPEDIPAQPEPELIGDLYPLVGYHGCVSMKDEPDDLVVDTKRNLDDSLCMYGDPEGDKTMVLVGGSHSEQWFSPLHHAAEQGGYQMLTLLRQGCAATFQESPDFDGLCAPWGHAAAEYILELDPDLVVTTGTRPGTEPGNLIDYTPVGYVDFWDEMLGHDVPVLAIRDTPWPYNADDVLFEPTDCYVRTHGDEEACGIDRDRVMAPENESEAILEPYDNAYTLDFTDFLCDEEKCPAVIGNVYVYRDESHLSDAIARSFTLEMLRQLLPILDEVRDRSDTSG